MKTYSLTINTIDNLYGNYLVEAKDIQEAIIKAKKAFLRDYPGADENFKLELENPNKENVVEIIEMLREE